MKKTMMLAVLGVLGFAGPALAETSYVLQHDPSGAPMCFTDDGQKAPLAMCPNAHQYTKVLDPSGAPMCFNEVGGKAPLARCVQSTIDLLVQR